MATFNATGTRLDHAREALEAALAMSGKAALLDLGLGIGIAVGPAVVGRTVADGNVSVLGTTTNLAARLQTAAQAGEIVLSDEAHRRVAQWLAERGLQRLADARAQGVRRTAASVAASRRHNALTSWRCCGPGSGESPQARRGPRIPRPSPRSRGAAPGLACEPRSRRHVVVGVAFATCSPRAEVERRPVPGERRPRIRSRAVHERSQVHGRRPGIGGAGASRGVDVLPCPASPGGSEEEDLEPVAA